MQNAEECDTLKRFFFSELKKFGEEWNEAARCVRVRVLFKDLVGLTTLQAGSEAAADSSNGHAELKQESYRVRCS